ncbi:unnamed protein product [Microthlaspi erraticum]|uniref:Uncharacterized protein n=1 Tax=Microthlaspi erraticum TaxID=1685480 RepID=A0A6D2KXD2_9BRAS|nr:unnamed protein product [Microthlaspi erraticum]
MGSSSSSSDSASSMASSWSLAHFLNLDSPLLLPLHSQSHHFLLHWRPLPSLNKVHSNLKLPLLTLTTNGSFLFLVLLSSLNLSLQTAPQRDISLICFPLFDLTIPNPCILSLSLFLAF